MKLDNVTTNKGKLVYNRRIPVDLKHLYPSSKEPYFRCRLRVQKESAAMVAEHGALQAAFARLVEDARDGSPEAFGDSGMARYKQMAWSSIDDPRTEREKWEDMRAEAEDLIRSVRVAVVDQLGDGGDEERRQIAAEQIERDKGEPLLYRAVSQPHAAPPPATLADAANVYEKRAPRGEPKQVRKKHLQQDQASARNLVGPTSKSASDRSYTRACPEGSR